MVEETEKTTTTKDMREPEKISNPENDNKQHLELQKPVLLHLVSLMECDCLQVDEQKRLMTLPHKPISLIMDLVNTKYTQQATWKKILRVS